MIKFRWLKRKYNTIRPIFSRFKKTSTVEFEFENYKIVITNEFYNDSPVIQILSKKDELYKCDWYSESIDNLVNEKLKNKILEKENEICQ